MPRGYDDRLADAPSAQGNGTNPHSGRSSSAIPAERRLPGLQDDERLPWLDAGDDPQGAGIDATRVWAVVLIGLALLIAVGAGVWWATHRNADGPQLADGSLIAAPPGPIKEAPRDPGGKTFDGTGDSSFAVSQGHSPGSGPTGRGDASGVDGAAMPPVSAAESDVQPTVADGASTARPAGTATGGIGVQLGAFSSEQEAQTAWDNLVKTYDPLAGAGHRIVAGQADIGTVYRLQAVAGSDGAAVALCARLKAAGLNCQVQD